MVRSFRSSFLVVRAIGLVWVSRRGVAICNSGPRAKWCSTRRTARGGHRDARERPQRVVQSQGTHAADGTGADNGHRGQRPRRAKDIGVFQPHGARLPQYVMGRLVEDYGAPYGVEPHCRSSGMAPSAPSHWSAASCASPARSAHDDLLFDGDRGLARRPLLHPAAPHAKGRESGGGDRHRDRRQYRCGRRHWAICSPAAARGHHCHHQHCTRNTFHYAIR